MKDVFPWKKKKPLFCISTVGINLIFDLLQTLLNCLGNLLGQVTLSSRKWVFLVLVRTSRRQLAMEVFGLMSMQKESFQREQRCLSFELFCEPELERNHNCNFGQTLCAWIISLQIETNQWKLKESERKSHKNNNNYTKIN